MKTEVVAPESLPKEVKISFLEERKRVWMQIIEISESASKNENLPQYIAHWAEISKDAIERIKRIDDEIIFLKSGTI